ncbi:hypothetical protein D9758_006681 [Tetrapyrgos nigripes]|uniref:Uncharacterized protein n=1 Tax=Tetrapyrgos nigripes TaxID=182062 RepID=A0A8H5GJ93_9AGAR|nr:hypothetical protein D9758_006681 [Tetrapyrgos nigripes]
MENKPPTQQPRDPVAIMSQSETSWPKQNDNLTSQGDNVEELESRSPEPQIRTATRIRSAKATLILMPPRKSVTSS